MKAQENLIEPLSSYFESRSDVAFAFLFGSRAKGGFHANSDLDIAVYFYPEKKELEVEEEVFYPNEGEIWADVDRISSVETDLLVLNRAPAHVGYTAIAEGISLGISDRNLFWTYTLNAGRLFEEYTDFTKSYLAIKARSLSISDTDRNRLYRIIDFFESEIDDLTQFSQIDYKKYSRDSALRRNVERWIENMVNASVDIAKILVSSEKQTIPQTYRETVIRLKTFPGFCDSLVESVSQHIRLRNILAREYLDIRFKHISRFVQEAPAHYRDFISAARTFLSKQE